MRSFSVATGATPMLTQLATGTTGAGYGGSFPVVSSNGATAGTGVVWLIRRDTTEQLEAYDAVNLGAPLFQANAGSWNTSGPFLSPLVAKRPRLCAGLPDGDGVRADELISMCPAFPRDRGVFSIFKRGMIGMYLRCGEQRSQRT